MDQQEVKNMAHRFITELHHVEDGDAASIDKMVDMFSDNAELSNPIIEHSEGTRHGREGIAEFWRDYRASLGEVHSEFFDITASDHSVGLYWRTTGKNAAGQPLDYEGVTLLVFDEAGKISSFKGFFDVEDMTFKARTH